MKFERSQGIAVIVAIAISLLCTHAFANSKKMDLHRITPKTKICSADGKAFRYRHARELLENISCLDSRPLIRAFRHLQKPPSNPKSISS